jgi:hypothetical protein
MSNRVGLAYSRSILPLESYLTSMASEDQPLCLLDDRRRTRHPQAQSCVIGGRGKTRLLRRSARFDNGVHFMHNLATSHPAGFVRP